MDNAEEIMQSLEEFSKMKPKDIPHELDDYLGYVAKTGDPVFKWSIIKCLFREKLVNVITDFYESTLSIELPPCPNVDPFNYERMKANLLEKLDSFHGAPFTVQRISELLTNPRKEYNRADKFMRAIEKNILVVSTREPGRIPEGECENDPSFNGIPDANDSGVETGFPCNDLTDPDSSSQTYEVSTESIENAYSVTVDTVSDSSGSSILSVSEPVMQEDTFVVSRTESEEVRVEPSTSAELKDTVEDNKESESVICSTPATSSQEMVEVVDPIPDVPVDETLKTVAEPVELVETPVPSTSEAAPADLSLEPMAEPGPSTSQADPSTSQADPSTSQADPTTSQADPSTSQAEPSTSQAEPSTSKANPEPERLSLEEATSSSQIEEPSIEKTEPTTPEAEPTTSQDVVLPEEPAAGISGCGGDADESEVEVPVSTSDSEVELRCQEAASFEDDRPKPDTNDVVVPQDPVPQAVLLTEPQISPIEEPLVEPQEVKESMDTGPADEAGDRLVISPCADSSSESKPEVAEGSDDQSRENSVIHTTSSDEPMEVDECQTSSSEQSQP